MSEKVCVVCLNVCNSSVAATAYELDDRIDKARTKNLGLCPEHQEFFKEGMVAVIEIHKVTNEEEYSAMASRAEGRTGNMLYLPKEAVLTLVDDFPPNNAVLFCEREPFERIKKASKDLWS